MDIAMSQLAKQGPRLTAPSRFLQKLILSFIGCTMGMAGFGIWLVSSVSGDPVMLLIKLGLSLFMLIVGLCCMLVARS
ncbi:hypothetical protein [uncultured Pelagimonas sp.]|uniref:hypothetical protein n=1 Tax=uncultured Pelagimonas sp. TaxID=1618102 RepID=UPI00260D2F62|nr:hypothetical protein [uncultured Pelagimonas sp.]